MQQTREEIYELARIAEKQHAWTALQPTTRTYRNIEMGTPLQNLHAAVRMMDTMIAPRDWVAVGSTAREVMSNLLAAARAIVTEHTVTQEIQQLLSGKEWDSDTIESVADILREHGYPIREVEPTLAPNNAPAEVIAAFMEVQKYYPDVESVVYDTKGNGCYRDSDGDPLTFGVEISTDILVSGANKAAWPSVYFLVEG